MLDVIIIGGGPAGLNAAVVLGRCRRKILVFDTGEQRNRRSHGIHNYLTRDDILPIDFIKITHGELRKYGVKIIRDKVISAKPQENSFLLKTEKGKTYYSKKILIATGLVDNIPKLLNIELFIGKSVFHCPYCDGWEVRDKKIGIYARNKNGFDLALSLLTWSKRVTYFTDGRNSLKPGQHELLQQHGIGIYKDPILELSGNEGKLKKIHFKNGNSIALDALFFVSGYTQHSELCVDLGCTMSSKNVAITNKAQQTNIPGVYIAGDASYDMHFVVVAAAEGAKAAVTINKELQREEVQSNQFRVQSGKN